MDDKINEEAYLMWRIRHYRYMETEQLLAKISFPEKQERNWLKLAREAQFLSTTEIARRTKVWPAAYTRLERAEATGRLTLRNLQRAAEAMDCEFVYAIRPKNKLTFSRMVWSIIAAAIKQDSRVGSRVARARGFMQNPSVRSANGWTFHKGYSGQIHYP